MGWLVVVEIEREGRCGCRGRSGIVGLLFCTFDEGAEDEEEEETSEGRYVEQEEDESKTID